jgi:GDP-4-dehydro-6-deoxy-D-mannose reductase
MAVGEPRRILMTGSSGFVGRHLLPLLRASFPGVEIFTNRIDITNRDVVSQAVRAAQPDACIHLAAISSVMAAKRDPEPTWRVNLHGALNIAQAVLEHAPRCHLLFASSSEIYGASFREGQPLDEFALLAPMNSYAATKAAADLALGSMASEGLRVVRLRLFNHTGPGQSEAFVVPAFARQIARIEAGHQPPRLHVGALDSQRDFLDVRDVGSAYVACLRVAPKLLPGTIINIASGIPRKIGDILDGLMDIAGLHPEIVINGARVRSSEIISASGDAARARQLLGWTPKTPWTQTLADVLADWRKLTADDTTVPDPSRP